MGKAEVEVEVELCEWARLPVTVRLSQTVDERLIPTLEQEEKGEAADNWRFDVLWAAREAIAIQSAAPADGRCIS